MIASVRICDLDGKPVGESEIFKQLLAVDVRAAVRATTRVWVDFDKIRKHGSDELNNVVELITNGIAPGNRQKRSEAG